MSKMTNDDWETDPDFVRDMDEIDQRWGSKRTVGSINMNELIDQVRRDHKTMRDKNQHSSQRDYSGGFSRDDLMSSPGYGSQERISRRVITTSSESSYIRETSTNGQVKDAAKESMIEKSSTSDIQKSQEQAPPLAPKPSSLVSRSTSQFTGSARAQDTPVVRSTSSARTEQPDVRRVTEMPYDRLGTEPSRQFKAGIGSCSFDKKQAGSPRDNAADKPRGTVGQSQAFKSIQDKIDAFQREFREIESKVASKSDMSRLTKKTSNMDNSSDSVQYASRSKERLDGTSPGCRDFPVRSKTTSPPMNESSSLGERPTSTSPLRETASVASQPKATSIKSLSERFEAIGRETSDDFRKRMEERRREFFDKIKSQVRETRKGLDGFDMIDSDDEGCYSPARDNLRGPQSYFAKSTSPLGVRQGASKPSGAEPPYSGASSRISSSSKLPSADKPKVYSKRETTREQVVSSFVKENDKVIHDETKRNVERSSSRHGSSDDDETSQPSSIKFIERELRSSPHEQRIRSPIIDEIKQKVPRVEASNKGAGLMARTLYDYQAVEHDELTFDVDDLITNIEKIDQGWYKGTITKGDRKQVGLFPANYVKLLNDKDEY